MLGDDEHPISFRFAPRIEGAHVKIVVWAGLAGMRGTCGELTMRTEEWAVLRCALATYPFAPLELVTLPTPNGRGEHYKKVSIEPFEFGMHGTLR